MPCPEDPTDTDRTSDLWRPPAGPEGSSCRAAAGSFTVTGRGGQGGPQSWAVRPGLQGPSQVACVSPATVPSHHRKPLRGGSAGRVRVAPPRPTPPSLTLILEQRANSWEEGAGPLGRAGLRGESPSPSRGFLHGPLRAQPPRRPALTPAALSHSRGTRRTKGPFSGRGAPGRAAISARGHSLSGGPRPGRGQASSRHPTQRLTPGDPLSAALRAPHRGSSPSPRLPLPSRTTGPTPPADTYNAHQRFPLHHVHELDGDFLPAAALGLPGAGAQVGAADDVLVVHQGPVPWRLLPRKRHLCLAAMDDRAGGKSEGSKAGGCVFYYYTSILSGWSLDSIITGFLMDAPSQQSCGQTRGPHLHVPLGKSPSL